MKVLVLCGDHWHPPEIARQGLEALPTHEFTFDWIEDTGNWSPESILDFPLIVLAKSNNVSATDQAGWMAESIQAAFADYVRKGNGLLAIHAGTAEYDQMSVLRSLLGGVFSHHPEQCPVTMTPKMDHPLSEGSALFTLKDEHYFMTMYDPQVDVFLTTTSEHGEQPGGWKRVEGNGRVAVLTPGHNLDVWLHPSYQKLLINSLHWCGMPFNYNEAGGPEAGNESDLW